mmetsp:Transcript_27008/g.54353  ORF Transcript_27008/g.54353 Transcript_27008/m.54353 type:complete len:270 (+) Transcript_27008:319-1128(+)
MPRRRVHHAEGRRPAVPRQALPDPAGQVQPALWRAQAAQLDLCREPLRRVGALHRDGVLREEQRPARARRGGDAAVVQVQVLHAALREHRVRGGRRRKAGPRRRRRRQNQLHVSVGDVQEGPAVAHGFDQRGRPAFRAVREPERGEEGGPLPRPEGGRAAAVRRRDRGGAHEPRELPEPLRPPGVHRHLFVHLPRRAGLGRLAGRVPGHGQDDAGAGEAVPPRQDHDPAQARGGGQDGAPARAAPRRPRHCAAEHGAALPGAAGAHAEA